jgi:hypothetical protein
MRPLTAHLPLLAVLVGTLFAAGGCSSMPPAQTGADASASADGQQSTMVYHDFDDVLVPRNMTVIRKESFVYGTIGFKAGVLALKGRVDANSLVTFFEVNMKKDNWRMISQIKTPYILMLFQKENRWCVIALHEETYNTYTRIWLAPTLAETESGLLR